MQPKNKAAERAAYDKRGLVWMTGDVLSRENLAFSDGHETGWAMAEAHFAAEIGRLTAELERYRSECERLKNRPAQLSASYHDLHITTAELSRSSIFNLPYNLMITCTRVGGWEVWRIDGANRQTRIAGEFYDAGLRLDTAGRIIVDSLKSQISESSNGEVGKVKNISALSSLSAV